MSALIRQLGRSASDRMQLKTRLESVDSDSPEGISGAEEQQLRVSER